MTRSHLVTFSDESMSRAAELCVDSALQNGVDRCATTGPSQRPFNYDWLTDSPLFEMRSPEFWRSRGIGYWTWKPYIIEQVIRRCNKREILIHADAGIEFIDNVNHIISRMDQDIFLFGNNWEHAHWCKRDVVEEIWPQREWNKAITEAGDQWLREPWQRFGKQVQASVIFFRVSDYTRKFVKEWLDWCLFESGRLIDDSPSRLPNHPQFQEHRHDQAILTTMAYREGIKLHYWPAMYNDGAFTYEKLPEYASDDYPILLHHHRRRNHEWK